MRLYPGAAFETVMENINMLVLFIMSGKGICTPEATEVEDTHTLDIEILFRQNRTIKRFFYFPLCLIGWTSS